MGWEIQSLAAAGQHNNPKIPSSEQNPAFLQVLGSPTHMHACSQPHFQHYVTVPGDRPQTLWDVSQGFSDINSTCARCDGSNNRMSNKSYVTHTHTLLSLYSGPRLAPPHMCARGGSIFSFLDTLKNSSPQPIPHSLRIVCKLSYAAAASATHTCVRAGSNIPTPKKMRAWFFPLTVACFHHNF